MSVCESAFYKYVRYYLKIPDIPNPQTLITPHGLWSTSRHLPCYYVGLVLNERISRYLQMTVFSSNFIKFFLLWLGPSFHDDLKWNETEKQIFTNNCVWKIPKEWLEYIRYVLIIRDWHYLIQLKNAEMKDNALTTVKWGNLE